MKLVENQIFHIYNRGNNRQPIFFKEENYHFFLKKVRKHLLPTCELLAYCLMPNHFHFLIKTDSRTVAVVAKNEKDIALTAFSKGLRILLSSYAQAIQKQEKMTGSLFQQKTKKKQVSSEWSWEDYTLICFRYILQNPVRARLVENPSEWPYSNCQDLFGLRKGTLC
ncbi:MAG: transposase, partial [Saprospiraceae bacterium]